MTGLKEVERRIESGHPPAGLQRLAEVLTKRPAAVPAARRSAEQLSACADAVHVHPFTALEARGSAAVATAVTGLLDDGRRVLVTGTDAEELRSVRDALPTTMRRLCVDGPVQLTVAEQRELRFLLVTATAQRWSRLGQTLPDDDALPALDRVETLCRAAGQIPESAREEADLVPWLLVGLDQERLGELVDAARACAAALDAVAAGTDARWTAPLLERLVFGRDRSGFDELVTRARDTVEAAKRLSAAGGKKDPVSLWGALPPDAADKLRAYADHLESGGRARVYFRSPEQRDAEPVLRQLRMLDGSLPSAARLRDALRAVELHTAIESFGAAAREQDVPAPAGVPAVTRRLRQLTEVDAAAKAVEALRRAVLFLHESSPVTMPDVPAVRRVARAILAYDDGENADTAASQLSGLADTLESSVPDEARSPEQRELVAGLRESDLSRYAFGLSDLACARRERADQLRCVELLSRLRDEAPGLAEAWEEAGSRTPTQGTVRFLPVAELLAEVPSADSADVVLVLSADGLGAENLILAAAAPRLVAVADEFGPLPPVSGSGNLASRLASSRDSLLTILRRAAVPVVVVGAEGGPDDDEGSAGIQPQKTELGSAAISSSSSAGLALGGR